MRLASVVPLPTDAQIENSEFAHAGTYMEAMQGGDAETLAQFEAEQLCEWGGVPDADVCGSMPSRIGHLVDCILYRIKQPAKPEEPLGVLTRREFRGWALKNVQNNGGAWITEPWAIETDIGEK